VGRCGLDASGLGEGPVVAVGNVAINHGAPQ
jgi:hypothetical protein